MTLLSLCLSQKKFFARAIRQICQTFPFKLQKEAFKTKPHRFDFGLNFVLEALGSVSLTSVCKPPRALFNFLPKNRCPL